MLRASPFHTADPDSASNSLGALDEVHALERLLEQAPPGVEVRRVCEVESDGRRLPVYAIGMGNPARDSPAVGFFGGVHGLERIGTQLLLRFLGQLLARWPHDRAMRQRLEHVRLVFMPLVNPGGMLRATRCNPRGVDLMRNAPVQASMRVPFMLGGQRLSAMLPWYRGRKGAAMESESEALCQLVEDELLDRKVFNFLLNRSGLNCSIVQGGTIRKGEMIRPA